MGRGPEGIQPKGQRDDQRDDHEADQGDCPPTPTTIKQFAHRFPHPLDLLKVHAAEEVLHRMAGDGHNPHTIDVSYGNSHIPNVAQRPSFCMNRQACCRLPAVQRHRPTTVAGASQHNEHRLITAVEAKFHEAPSVLIHSPCRADKFETKVAIIHGQGEARQRHTQQS